MTAKATAPCRSRIAPTVPTPRRRITRVPISVVGVSLVGMLAATGAARAQSAPVSAFVILADSDTVAIETVTRSPGKLVGDLRLIRQGARVRYEVTLRPDGNPASVTVHDDARRYFNGTVVFDTSTERKLASSASGRSNRFVFAPARSYPIVGMSIALMDQLVRVLHPKVGSASQTDVVNIRNQSIGKVNVNRVSADTVVVQCTGCQRIGATEEMRLAVGKNDDVIGGLVGAKGWVVKRTSLRH